MRDPIVIVFVLRWWMVVAMLAIAIVSYLVNRADHKRHLEQMDEIHRRSDESYRRIRDEIRAAYDEDDNDWPPPTVGE
jgi:hypothetical protein